MHEAQSALSSLRYCLLKEGRMIQSDLLLHGSSLLLMAMALWRAPQLCGNAAYRYRQGVASPLKAIGLPWYHPLNGVPSLTKRLSYA